jgi:hypothetical protein
MAASSRRKGVQQSRARHQRQAPAEAGPTWADAGPGVNNPAQNVLNYGGCVAIYGVFGLGSPLEFLQNNTPGVVFQYQPYDTGETRDVRPGTACSVGFLAPPPGND